MDLDFNGSADGIYVFALTADGKILAAGRSLSSASSYDFAVARFNPDGSLDSTFGAGG